MKARRFEKRAAGRTEQPASRFPGAMRPAEEVVPAVHGGVEQSVRRA